MVDVDASARRMTEAGGMGRTRVLLRRAGIPWRPRGHRMVCFQRAHLEAHYHTAAGKRVVSMVLAMVLMSSVG